MRVFLALALAPIVRAELISLMERLRRSSQAQVKWVEEDNLHLTLHFLGEVKEADILLIKEIMKEAASGVEPFELHIEGTGVFPNIDRARVIWAGVRAGQGLYTLHRRLADRLAAGGWEVERRPYSPHITLGRVRFIQPSPSLGAALDIEKDQVWGKCRVDQIILMESRLSPAGPAYLPLALYRLCLKERGHTC